MFYFVPMSSIPTDEATKKVIVYSEYEFTLILCLRQILRDFVPGNIARVLECRAIFVKFGSGNSLELFSDSFGLEIARP